MKDIQISNNKTQSPKLAAAMEEIKDILKKHDIAGVCFLYEDDLGEYLLHPNTSKSVMHLKNNGELRFRSKLKEDFNEDAAKKHACDTYTVGMLRIFIDMMEMMKDNLINIYSVVAQKLDVEHGEGIHTPRIYPDSSKH